MEENPTVRTVIREMEKAGMREKDLCWVLQLTPDTLRRIKGGWWPPPKLERHALANYLAFRRCAKKLMESLENHPGA